MLWQETGIGKTVNAYRKHCSEIVGNVARHLVTKWKQLVQFTTEAISETQCATPAHSDPLTTADTGEKVVISKVDRHHLGTSSSKHKHLNASGNSAASKHHSSAVVKSNRSNKPNDDKISSSRCSQSEVSTASLPVRFAGDESGYGSNTSHSQSASKMSAYVNETTESSAGGLPLLNIPTATCDKSHREKHRKLSKDTANDKNKEECNVNSKLPATASKSAPHTGSHMSQSHHMNLDGCTTDKMSSKSGKQFVSEDYTETSLRQSVTKDVAKTQSIAGHKGSEKKSLNVCISDRDSHSSASVSSSARTHNPGHMSQHQNYADAKTFPTADDLDDGESKGMTFEQMLNYDDHRSIARKKKRSVHGDGKQSKVHSIASSHSSSLASSSMTKHSNKPDSGLVLKRISHVLKTYPKLTALNGELEISQLNRQPVIPHPASQVCWFLCLL